MELKNVVRFPTHPRPFLVKDTYCGNPDCTCNEVFLTFTEVADSDRSLRDPVSFAIRVNLESWHESEPPERSPKVTAWVREFLDQCPSTRRAEFKASYEEGKRIAKRKAEYMLDVDEVLEGALVSYANILTEQKPLSAGGSAYTFDFSHQGCEYLVEDRYCANPRCDCQEVHLEFFEVVSSDDDKQPRVGIYQRFLGKVTFAGRWTVVERMKCRPAKANAVLSAWWEECHDHLKMLKDRYREVKEIGQRSLEAAPTRQVTSLQATSGPITGDVPLNNHPVANAKVGRNAPCPCGSGKKYKKCCWRRPALPV